MVQVLELKKVVSVNTNLSSFKKKLSLYTLRGSIVPWGTLTCNSYL